MQEYAKWVTKIKFLHSLHNFGVCLRVLISLFGKIFGCAHFLGFIGSKVGTNKYANKIFVQKIEVRNEYEKKISSNITTGLICIKTCIALMFWNTSQKYHLLIE